ncbi:hypothetical protein TrST_g10758 [Triparma strigata]|uniref:EF-hand domain-containing protein n=1 Tax=Triparma strigata TaxID=1606541 RepID=A0A9W7BV47_9STRA|nr:hypothetical protein TrST_g10758 [Triparma strigata]
MGSQFSMGIYEEIITPYTALDMESIRRKYNKFNIMCDKEYENDGFFMSRKQFQDVFEIPTADLVYRIFAFFDPRQHGHVVSTDVWGGLCLACSAKEEAKLSFLFQLADKNSDKFINHPELIMIMHSSSRGFSRMKQIEAPPMEKIEEICDSGFNHPEVKLDDRGEMGLQDVVMIASADERLRSYLSNLDSSAGADIGNLYKQQAQYLRELAMIDAVMDTMKRHDRDMSVDEEDYEKERGGDIKDIVYDGLFENPSDIARMYLHKLLKSDEDYKLKQASMKNKKRMTMAEKRASQRETQLNKAVLVVPVNAGEREVESLTQEEEMKQRAENAKILQEAQAQASRRAKRKRQMREEEEKEAGTFGDAAAFKIGYKRVQAARSASNASGDAAEDIVAANQMTSKWATMKVNNDNMQRLDVDLLEDLVEATGNIIHDREAKAALEKLPTNQLGKHTLDCVIKWWKERQRLRRMPAVPPWRKRLDVVLNFISKPWEALEFLKEETHRQEEEEYQRMLRGEEQKPTVGDEKKDEGDNNFAPGGLVKPAWESDEEEEEEEKNCKINARLAIGHVTKATVSSIKFDIAATNIGGGANATAPPPPSTSGGGRPSSPMRAGTPSTPGRPVSRGQTAASHIRTYAYHILTDAFRTADAEWNRKNETIAQEGGGYKSVTWIDFPVNDTASEELENKCIAQLTRAFDSVPKDYAKSLYVSNKVEMVHLSSRDAKRYIRVTLLNNRDPFLEVEKFLPPDIKLKDAIDNLSLHVDLNVGLDDILALTQQYVGFEERCYGPQEDELGEKGMDPSVFMNSVKQRRKAALRAAKKAHRKEMSLPEMKEHLISRGFSVDGSINEIRERTKQMFAVQAEMCGYGELSNFGEEVANSIFKRCDRDNDGLLNFWEMNVLQRGLGGIALEYPAKYHQAMFQSGFANESGMLHKDGLVAYYERFGQLTKDIKGLGIGSVDDYVCAKVSAVGEIRSKVVAGIDKLFDQAREAHRGMKWTNFISRFIKEFYLDWECKRLSDLFLKEEVPKLLVQPGGPAHLLREWKKILADGRRGYIPEMREGVERKLGKRWGWSKEDEWTIFSEEEQKERDAEKERQKVDRCANAGIAKGIKVEDYGIGTLQGWKDFKLADGTQPLWLRQALKSMEEEEEREKEQDEGDSIKFGEVTDVGLDTIERIAQLKNELAGLTEALSRALPRRQRDELMEMEATKSEEKTKLEKALERGVLVSCHHFLRSYDALRNVCTGVHSINWGNHAFTTRFEAEGFDFFSLLPEGCHEPSVVAAEQAARQRRAVERKAEAKKFILEERRKRVMEAKEREAMKIHLADKKKKEREEEELTLYTRGAEARVRGYHKKSDQTLCIEMWRRLFLLFENRYDQMDDNRDITAMAVACNNLGVVLFEFGDGQVNFQREAVIRLRKADGYMDDTLRFYKNKAKMAILEAQKEKRLELVKMAEEKRRQRAKREQAAKGEKLLRGNKEGVKDDAAQRRKTKLLENASMEVRMAEKAAKEAEEMEKSILAEFESSDSDDRGEEKKKERDDDENNSDADFNSDEAEDDFDVDDIVARAAGGNTPATTPAQGENPRKKKSKKGGSKEKSTKNKHFRRRTTLIPDGLVKRVPIPEHIALAAAIVKCNLVSILNEMGDPVDEEENDERQHMQYDTYMLYKNFVGEETKQKTPIGDKIVIKSIGVARLDAFPPENFEEWSVRTTQEDIENARLEEEKRQALLRQKKLEKEARKAVKEERRKKRKEKKQRKLMREFKMHELDAIAGGGEIDLDHLEMINPKKAAKIRDRQFRMEEAAKRRKMIKEQRLQREKEEADEKAKVDEKARRERIKLQAIEDEIEDILAEDSKLRNGLNGIVSGFRWTAKPDVEKIRQEIIDREAALKFEAKEAKKRRKEQEKEREKKLREKAEKRARRAMENASDSDSDSSDESVKSDLTDDSNKNKKGERRKTEIEANNNGKRRSVGSGEKRRMSLSNPFARSPSPSPSPNKGGNRLTKMFGR